MCGVDDTPLDVGLRLASLAVTKRFAMSRQTRNPDRANRVGPDVEPCSFVRGRSLGAKRRGGKRRGWQAARVAGGARGKRPGWRAAGRWQARGWQTTRAAGGTITRRREASRAG